MKIYAHRGCTRDCPENTRPALLSAQGLGVQGIEFDVRLSRDGVPMVIHDERIDRTSDGTGPVGSLSLAELKQLDAGSWFSAQYAGERFVTLDEALELLDPALELNVHLKPAGANTEHLVQRCTTALVEHDRLATAYLTGDEDMMRLARSQPHHVRRCCLVPHPRNTMAAVDLALALGCCNMQVGHSQIDAAFIELAHTRGLPIHAMYLGPEARDLNEMRRLAACGIDALMLDHVEIWLGAGSATDGLP